MRSVLVFLIIGIFFAILSVFIIQSFSPFDEVKINELIKSEKISQNSPETLNENIKSLIQQGLIFDYLSNNAFLTLFAIESSFFCFLTSAHLFIDKVFFRNLWQQPSLFNAIRRSFLISISIGLIIYLKFLRVQDTTLLLIPFSALCIELILASFKKDFSKFLNRKTSPTIK